MTTGLLALANFLRLRSGALSSFFDCAMQRTSAPNIAGAHLPQRARGYWKARFSATREGVESFLERERGQLPLWLVVGFGAGIASWFALGRPERVAGRHVPRGSALAIAGFAFDGGRLERAIGWLGLALALGCAPGLAAVRMGRRRRGSKGRWSRALTARVERVETLAAKGDLRLTLAPIDAGLPPRVRVSVKAGGAPTGHCGRCAGSRCAPGLTASAADGVARNARFRPRRLVPGIGAVGRALGDDRGPRAAGCRAASIRSATASAAIFASSCPDASGSIATALATGDQNAVAEEDAEAMRRSGLAHLLSVSGLHIAAVIGAAMLLTLKLLALSERLALRFNLVLVAAGVGALAGVGYTLLTGSAGADGAKLHRRFAGARRNGAGAGRDQPAAGRGRGADRAAVPARKRSPGASFQFSFAAVTAIIALHSSGWGRRCSCAATKARSARRFAQAARA